MTIPEKQQTEQENRDQAEWEAEMKAHKIEQMHDFCNERELAIVTEQRDRLAVALQTLRSCIQDTRGKDAYEAVKNADEALQSLTPYAEL